MVIRSKWKYRKPKPVRQNGKMRMRNGPKCCNEGCGSRRKKGRRAARPREDRT